MKETGIQKEESPDWRIGEDKLDAPTTKLGKGRRRRSLKDTAFETLLLVHVPEYYST